MKFKVGDLVRVLPNANPGFGGDEEVHDQYREDGEKLCGLLGIVTEITDDRDCGYHGKDIWVHLQNGLNNIFYYDWELEKATK